MDEFKTCTHCFSPLPLKTNFPKVKPKMDGTMTYLSWCCTCKYEYSLEYMRKRRLLMHTYIRITYVHAYIRVYIQTDIHTCMHACMHAYIHAYIHTYIGACWLRTMTLVHHPNPGLLRTLRSLEISLSSNKSLSLSSNKILSLFQ
jgi:hypothetical protein